MSAGGDLFGGPALEEQVSELRRELATRDTVYPRLIAGGRLTRERADLQVARLRAALTTVEAVALGDRAPAPAPGATLPPPAELAELFGLAVAFLDQLAEAGGVPLHPDRAAVPMRLARPGHEPTGDETALALQSLARVRRVLAALHDAPAVLGRTERRRAGDRIAAWVASLQSIGVAGRGGRR